MPEPDPELPVTTGETSASGSVGDHGAVLRLEGGAALVIPKGAMSAADMLSISSSGAIPDAVPQGPNGRQPASDVITTLPHGMQFDKPIELRMPVPAGLPGDALSLYTQAGDASDWVEHTDVKFGAADGLAVVTTSHFSHWAWFRKPGGPASISDSAVFDTQGGWAYYSAYNSPGKYWEVRRASLTPGASFETLFAEPNGTTTVSVIAAGAEDLFFYRKKDGTIARMKRDGSVLTLAWADVSTPEYRFQNGLLTATDLYTDYLRIPLATGVPEKFDFLITGLCAMSPDRARVGCHGQELVFDGGAKTTLKSVDGLPAPNGKVVTDGSNWYFLTSEADPNGRLEKAAYGAQVTTRLVSFPAEVDQLAISGTKLFVGSAQDITAYDRDTGALLGKLSFTPNEGKAANALLEADETTVYYAGYGTAVSRIAISALIK